jgi:hypothetical protein
LSSGKLAAGDTSAGPLFQAKPLSRRRVALARRRR